MQLYYPGFKKKIAKNMIITISDLHQNLLYCCQKLYAGATMEGYSQWSLCVLSEYALRIENEMRKKSHYFTFA